MKKLTSIPKNLIHFVKSIFIELKQVEFPTRSASLRGTHLVIGISIVGAIVLLLMDALFTFVRNYLTLNI